MLDLNSLPAYKSIDVIDQKGNKADNNRKIPNVCYAGKYPKPNENPIVGGISQCKIGTSTEG